MTRQNIVDVLLALSAVGIDVWAEIKLDDGGAGGAVFSERMEAYMGSSTELKRIMRSSCCQCS